MIPNPVLPNVNEGGHLLRNLVRRLTELFRDYATEINKRSGGIYTPTLTNDANCSPDPTPAGPFQYIRVENVVTVSGKINVDPVSASPTVTKVGISLPFATTFAANYQCAGTGCSTTGDVTNAVIIGATTNAQLWWTSSATAARTIYIHFTYLILP